MGRRGAGWKPAFHRRAALRLGVIDTHCHLTFPEFAGRVEETLEEAAALGVTGMITVSTGVEDALHGLQIAEVHERVWCTAGVHPLYSDKGEGPDGEHQWERLRVVAEHPKCVAWGELGLDNHYSEPEGRIQRRVLAEELAFIRRCHDEGLGGKGTLPVVLHCREAFDDLIPVLAESGLDPARCVFHCFTAGPREARQCLDFGAWISFTGVVTYPNAPEVREAAKLVPADRIMVETDAPFLSPVPHRGKRPCKPAWVRHTAETLAEIRGVSFDAFHEQVNENTRRFFGIEAR